jgi:hypothetical protein
MAVCRPEPEASSWLRKAVSEPLQIALELPDEDFDRA